MQICQKIHFYRFCYDKIPTHIGRISPVTSLKGGVGGCSTPLLLEKSVSLVGFLTNFLPYRRNFDEIKSLWAEFFEDYTQLCRIFYYFRRIIVPSEFTPTYPSRSRDVTAYPRMAEPLLTLLPRLSGFSNRIPMKIAILKF